MLYNVPTPNEIATAIRVLDFFEFVLASTRAQQQYDTNGSQHMTRASQTLRSVERQGIIGAALKYEG